MAQLGQAVAKISHDLRNILTTSADLRGPAGRQRRPQGQAAHGAQAGGTRSRRAVNLCETTLAFGKAEEPASARCPCFNLCARWSAEVDRGGDPGDRKPRLARGLGRQAGGGRVPVRHSPQPDDSAPTATSFTACWHEPCLEMPARRSKATRPAPARSRSAPARTRRRLVDPRGRYRPRPAGKGAGEYLFKPFAGSIAQGRHRPWPRPSPPTWCAGMAARLELVRSDAGTGSEFCLNLPRHPARDPWLILPTRPDPAAGPDKIRARAVFSRFRPKPWHPARTFRLHPPTGVRRNRPHDGPVAQLDRAPDYESGGRAFESLRVRH